MGQRGEGWGGSKPGQGEPCRPQTDFGFCSDFHLKGFLWLLGGENSRRGRKWGDLWEGMAVMQVREDEVR